MRLSWLLFITSLRHSWRRLALISGSAAVGVAMLLLFTAEFNAMMNTKQDGWRTAIVQTMTDESHGTAKKIEGINPVYVEAGAGTNLHAWRDKQIVVIQMAPTGPHSPKLQDIKIPQQNEYYVSPALADIIKQHPEDKINERYGTTMLGLIPDTLLSGRDQLLAIKGMPLHELKEYGAARVYSFVPREIDVSAKQRIVISVVYLGIFILLFPIILLISIASQLGIVQREQRYAALRLVGATKRQITQFVMMESSVAAGAGMLIGWGIYSAGRVLLQDFTLKDVLYWPNDIMVTWWQTGLILFATGCLVLFASWWGMRHVRTSPLGVVKRQKIQKKPRIWRIIPVISGVIVIVALRLNTPKDQASADMIISVAGAVVLIMIGLVVVGPWIAMQMAAFVARRTQKATTLIGTAYISAHSAKVSRSVIGVSIALFAGSFYLTAVSGVAEAERSSTTTNSLSRLRPNSLLLDTANIQNSSMLPADFEQQLEKTVAENVEKIDVIGGVYSFLSCTQADQYLRSSACPDGKAEVAINFDAPVDESGSIIYGVDRDDIIKQLKDTMNFDPFSATMPRASSQYLIAAPQDKLDKIRSFLVQYPELMRSASLHTNNDGRYTTLSTAIVKLTQMTYIGIAITMVVATISLMVSTVGGLFERRRSLFTLRLTGMTIRQLKEMIIIESLLPLAITSIISAALGVWTGVLFMEMVSRTLDAQLSSMYFFVLLGSIGFATLGIYLILPIVDKITALTLNRSE